MYSIREANPDDHSALPRIEQAAGMMYLQTPYKDLAYGPNVSQSIDVSRDFVWVVSTEREIVAFAIVRLFGEVAHIYELDAHPQHARQGLGRALIAHVARWARARQLRALTLTTFEDVPWNGPYYMRLGFTKIDPAELSAHLRETLEQESAAGLPMRHRIAMEMRLLSHLPLE